jgi:hypothetical protein
MSQAAAAKRYNEQVALQVKLNPVHQNYNPPKELDSVIYFDDGASIDTTNNIMTMSNSTQIDTTTGLRYTDPASLISMANGAYLDTKTFSRCPMAPGWKRSPGSRSRCKPATVRVTS